MRNSKKTNWIVAVLIVVLTFSSLAQAYLTPVAGWGYTVGYGIGKACGFNKRGYGWIGWWDPPVDILRGRVTFAYNPSLITIHPEWSGFVGEFSDDPSINVPWNPDEVYPEFNADNFPGSRPEMVWNLNVGLNTVTLDFDLSANPVVEDSNTTGHTVFFGLFMETSVALTDWTVESTQTGDFYELGSPDDEILTYMVVRDATGFEYYAGESSSLGLTANPVPEPTTVLLLSLGGLLLRRRK